MFACSKKTIKDFGTKKRAYFRRVVGNVYALQANVIKCTFTDTQ